MIKNMLDAKAVGNYAVAVRLSEIWYFIPMAITGSLFPAIINAKKISEKLYHERLQKLYNLLVWLAIGIAVPMTFSSNWIVRFIFGDQFTQAGNVLRIHIWAGIFVFYGVVTGKWIIVENMQKIGLYTTLIGVSLNVILNLIMINAMGIIGAALASLGARLLSVYIAAIIFAPMRTTINYFHRSLLYPYYIIKTKKGNK